MYSPRKFDSFEKHSGMEPSAAGSERESKAVLFESMGEEDLILFVEKLEDASEAEMVSVGADLRRYVGEEKAVAAAIKAFTNWSEMSRHKKQLLLDTIRPESKD